MDLIFNCPHCNQELSVNPSGAGSEIDCPTCGQNITIPEAAAETTDTAPVPLREVSAIASSAAAKEVKHFNVPVRSEPTEVLVKKVAKPDAVSKDGEKKMRVRTIKRTECLEVGHDRFDETVSEFLSKVGEPNIVSVTPISYTHLDLNTRQNMLDYGVFIVFKG